MIVFVCVSHVGVGKAMKQINKAGPHKGTGLEMLSKTFITKGNVSLKAPMLRITGNKLAQTLQMAMQSQIDWQSIKSNKQQDDTQMGQLINARNARIAEAKNKDAENVDSVANVAALQLPVPAAANEIQMKVMKMMLMLKTMVKKNQQISMKKLLKLVVKLLN